VPFGALSVPFASFALLCSFSSLRFPSLHGGAVSIVRRSSLPDPPFSSVGGDGVAPAARFASASLCRCCRFRSVAARVRAAARIASASRCRCRRLRSVLLCRRASARSASAALCRCCRERSVLVCAGRRTRIASVGAVGVAVAAWSASAALCRCRRLYSVLR